MSVESGCRPLTVTSANVERLRQIIFSRPEIRGNLPAREPNWRQYQKSLKLPADQARQLVTCLQHTWLLPFDIYSQLAPLIEFAFLKLPAHEKRMTRDKCHRGQALCSLLRYLIRISMQGSSGFPPFTTDLAQQVRDMIRAYPHIPAGADALIALLIDPDDLTPLAGLNVTDLKDLQTVIEGEHDRRAGVMESVWKSDFKFKQFEKQVLAEKGFHSDWALLKKHFRVGDYRDSLGIIRRSMLPERNWNRFSTPPDLNDPSRRFQTCFDFFCWKWFLFGMKYDKPLIMKLYYALTPYGTQIFIPGFWSFDAARDLNWKKLLALHRARGLGRQGQKLDKNRTHRRKQLFLLAEAQTLARSKSLKGVARFDFLKKHAGFSPQTDDAQIRRLLKEAMVPVKKSKS